MLLFADSFDHYTSDDVSLKYSTTYECTIVPNGRCDTNCLRVPGGSVHGGVIKGVAPSTTTAIWGFAVKIQTLGSLASLSTLYYGGSAILALSRGLDGAIYGSLNPSSAFPTTFQVSEADVLRVGGQWYYLEFKVTVSSGGAGTINVRCNSEDVTAGGGITGLTFGASTWTAVALRTSLFGTTWLFDDFYIADTSGSAPWNDFLGDVRVEYLQPTANGATQQWDNTGGAAAWNSVDDGEEPDQDTSYISTNVATEEATFEYENSSLPTGATVFGVQMSFLAKKDEPGDRIIKAIVREGGVNYEGGAELFPSDDTYDYRHTIMQVNPADSAAWEITDVNANEFGVRLET